MRVHAVVEVMMNNAALIINLRELLIILMHNRTLCERSADALRYCREHIIEKEISVGVYGEYREVIDQLHYLANKDNRDAPDDVLRSGGDLLLSILLLYDRLASDIAVSEYTQKNNAFYF